MTMQSSSRLSSLAYCAVLIRLVGSQSWLWDEIGKDKAHCFLTIVQPLITSNAKELIWILNSSEVKGELEERRHRPFNGIVKMPKSHCSSTMCGSVT